MRLNHCLRLSLCVVVALVAWGGPRAAAQGAAEPPAGFKVSEIKEAALKSLLEASAGGGRALLVIFWATWCVPCRDEFPDLVKIRGRYSAERLDFVTVSLDDVSDIGSVVPQFLREMRATHIPAYLLNADDPEAAISFFDPTWRGELPATFLYDPRGQLVYKHRGRIKPPELQAAIDRALAGGAQAAPAQQPRAAEAAKPPAGGLAELLSYDERAPLELKAVGTERRDGAVVEDVTFRGVGETVEAYVVRPESGAGPFAGVLFVHWFEPSSPTSNRTQYLEEARALARRGTVSLLVSTFWSDPARYKARRWQTDFENSVAQAKNLRRALDVLVSLPGVDAGRVGLVGHDYGAMFGALVAAADARPKAYALIAGTSRFADWYLFGSSTGVPTGEDLARFRERLSQIDPVTALGRAKGSFFLQFGEHDKYTPRDNFLEFYRAAPEPKRIATYASDHDMAAEIIRHDRTVWLAEQLEIK
ncbi:MAG TPA: redoxin domain-containing protein [Pyrinomonadaceae bacterium]|nr:redoxin domain-containing protein [Pyrinomonadaceae bacterium]